MDTEREKGYLYWLTQVPSVGAVTIRRLWDRYHSFENIYNMEGKELKGLGMLPEKRARDFDQQKQFLEKALEEYGRLQEKGIRFVAFWEREYPRRLRSLYNSPAGLYVKGRLPEDSRPAAAIVGARSCSNYGRQAAQMLGRYLAGAGIQVVSGMALGIDGAGHRGALEAGGDTYGVLGCGVDICYPRSHFAMYLEIPKKGGILSEYKPGEAPASKNFPMRNRIISGLSDVIIVVEAREKSGSLITVDCGLDQGKEIFAVPGMITDSLSMGCNRLIRQGAGIVTCPEDILEYFHIFVDKKLRVDEKNENGLAKKEKMVYSCLDLQPKFIDRIVEECGLSLGECLTLLLELELEGRIVQTASHYYAKKL
ncbi:MAG: DNA-protecting protein DprA [Hungatella sp.]|nr:DNA-protecting protein DprA [Hungatella sp.]